MDKSKRIRKLNGLVVSDKADKTITVVVSRLAVHPKYGKRYKVSKRYSVHDPKNEAKQDQQVEFEACRPFSKNKRWQLVKVIK